MINILIRLHTDIDKFYKTLDSIKNQTYQKLNIIVSVDDLGIYEYITKNEKTCQYVYINPNNLHPGDTTDEIDINCKHSNQKIFGLLFMPNIYFNILHKYIKSGYILYLDVGDVLLNHKMFSVIEQYMILKYNILWQTIVKDKRIVPQVWVGYPVLCDIDSSSIMFHSDYIQIWTGYRRGDYRVIKEICKQNKNIFMKKIFVEKD